MVDTLHGSVHRAEVIGAVPSTRLRRRAARFLTLKSDGRAVQDVRRRNRGRGDARNESGPLALWEKGDLS